MKTVYKYQIHITDRQVISMPQDAQIIHANTDPSGIPCVWAIVDTTKPPEQVRIYVHGTGHPLHASAKTFIGTIKQGPLVWHVFQG